MLNNFRFFLTIYIILSIIGLIISPLILSFELVNQNYTSTEVIIRVDDDGDGDYSKIQQAIDNASIGDIIEVYSGLYPNENVTVDKQLTLKGIDTELGSGNDSGKPLLIGAIDHQPSMGLITIIADGCSVSGFYLKEKENSYCKEGVAIVSDNNYVFDNDVEDTNFGIEIYRDTSNNSVYNNTFPGCFYGIVSYSPNCKIFGNYITNSYGISLGKYAVSSEIYQNKIEGCISKGIGLRGADNTIIYENEIIDCNTGIINSFENEGKLEIYNNTINHCNKGISIERKNQKIHHNIISYCDMGLVVSGSGHKIFENNIFNNRLGIKLNSDNNNIYRNNISENEEIGISLHQSNCNEIFENNLTFNTMYGMYIESSVQNIIYHNNFIENPTNAYCTFSYPPYFWENFNNWHLGYVTGGGGNYWSDYDGKDNNDDGIGDKQYIIPDNYPNPLTNDIDKYPLIEPGGKPVSKSGIKNVIQFRPLFEFLELFINILKNIDIRFLII